MKKFLEYFYILSKLSTSLILFLSIIFVGYLFYKSYSPLSEDININDSKFEEIINLINSNHDKINTITNDIKNKFVKIENINQNIEKEKSETINANSKIDNLSNQIALLEKNITLLENKIDKLKKHNLENNLYSEDKSSLEDIKQIIYLKFMENTSIDNELEILSKIIDKNEYHHIDKILILKNKVFFDYHQLIREFELGSENYLKKNIIKKNSNYLIKFLTPIMRVEPSNKEFYSNKDISLLKNAKNYLITKNFKNCITEINKLTVQDEYFNIFIAQIKIYSDLKETLALIA
tara:strand:+ start:14224 stop:15102 length:879 start_codon:yes stop_codon:yes gene_type:complete